MVRFLANEPLAASAAEELTNSVRPTGGSTEHRTLEKEIGFRYHQVYGELTYAYVVGRIDISYAVTLLVRYSSAPDRCILPSSGCANTFDVLSIGDFCTGDKHRATFYLSMTSRSCLSTQIFIRVPEVL
jgi:hypothetical protein